MKLNFTTIFFILLVLFSCNGDTDSKTKKVDFSNKSDIVINHELAEATMLNPFNYSDAGAGNILANIFYPLLSIDYNTLEIVPLVAKSRPEIELTKDGGMRITYQIRPEATFDDGTPITAKDVEFALKVILNPKVDNPNQKPYYEFIKDIVFYDNDALKFTFICNDVYLLAETFSGDLVLLPKKIYDPKGLMNEFTIRELVTNAEKLASNKKIIEFATDFNSEKYQRDKSWIQGCGPYLLEEWQTGQKIVLKSQTPFREPDTSRIRLYEIIDANRKKIPYSLIKDSTNSCRYFLNAGLMPEKKYFYIADSASFGNIYN